MEKLLGKVTVGECSQLMATLPDDCVNLTVTSPPYDGLRQYKGFAFDFPAVAAQLWRITKPGGVVVWIVADQTDDYSESGESFRQALGFMECGFKLFDTMLYQKTGVVFPCAIRYHHCFEYMFVLAKGRPATVNLLRDRPNKLAGQKCCGNQREPDGTIVKKTCMKNGGTGRDIPAMGVRYNIWPYSPGHSKTAKDDLWHDHPAVMPLALASDHILSWSNPGDVVFDPMTGSGQTLIAAQTTGRQWFGFEISREYAKLARKRIKLYRT